MKNGPDNDPCGGNDGLRTVGLIDAGRNYPCWGFPGDNRWNNDE